MASVHNAGKLKFGAEKRGKREKSVFELGVIFDSSCATAAQAASVEHESDRP
jgi:diaminopimelate epimerase